MVRTNYIVELATVDGPWPLNAEYGRSFSTVASLTFAQISALRLEEVSGGWSNITDWVKSFSFSRGRDDVLSTIQTGTGRLVLSNADGRFSPGYSLSPLFGQMNSMRAIRFKAGGIQGSTAGTFANLATQTFSSVATQSFQSSQSFGGSALFFGYIQSITPDPRKDTQECVIELADGFCWFDLINTTPALTPSTLSGALIHQVLDSANWPTAARAIDSGRSLLSPVFVDQPVLTQLTTLGVTNENGIIYMDGSGKVQFDDRHSRKLGSRLVSAGVFSDTDTLSELHAERSAREIYNDIKITHSTGEVNISDPVSIARRGRRRLSISATLISSQEAVSRAYSTLSEKSVEADRPSVMFWANKSNTLMQHAVSRDLGDRITITDSVSRTGINADFFIERIEHAVSQGGSYHEVRWLLSPASLSSSWILDSSQLGISTRLDY